MESYLTSGIYAKALSASCSGPGAEEGRTVPSKSVTKERERQAEETERRGGGDGVLLKRESEGKKKKGQKEKRVVRELGGVLNRGKGR